MQKLQLYSLALVGPAFLFLGKEFDVKIANAIGFAAASEKVAIGLFVSGLFFSSVLGCTSMLNLVKHPAMVSTSRDVVVLGSFAVANLITQYTIGEIRVLLVVGSLLTGYILFACLAAAVLQTRIKN
ncbi:MAG: hypothetical protein ACR2IE_20250 [Candidatus Sumerlaeaceae bacterium]